MANGQELRLAGKVAIVTGGGRGLGRTEVLALASHGAKVVINDIGSNERGEGRETTVAENVAAEVRAMGGEAVVNSDNIAEMNGGKRVVETAMDAFGRLDILVNNAGNTVPSPVWEMTEAEWDSVISVHLKGHFTTVRHASPIFRDQRSGVIINTASESGLGHYNMSNYSAAKEGIVGFTRAIARDLGQYNIRCNAIRPRAMTRAIPEVIETIRYSQEELGIAVHGNRWVTGLADYNPEHIGQFVVWLCTDAASNVNGRDFYVGGGSIGLYSQPVIDRMIFRDEVWTPSMLDGDDVRDYLIGDLKNAFLGRNSG